MSNQMPSKGLIPSLPCNTNCSSKAMWSKSAGRILLVEQGVKKRSCRVPEPDFIEHLRQKGSFRWDTGS